MEEIVYILLVFVFIIMILNVCIIGLLFKNNERIINLNAEMIKLNKEIYGDLVYCIELMENKNDLSYEIHEKLLLMRENINVIRSRQLKIDDEIKEILKNEISKEIKKNKSIMKKGVRI